MRGKFLGKLIAGGDGRKSRLHTEQNVFIGLSSTFKQLPIVSLQKIHNSVFRKRSAVPWWPLPAIQAVERYLHRGMVAIEFGSGSSTLWIAKRVKTLVSHEHDREWAAITNQRILEEGLRNCSVLYREGDQYFVLDAKTKRYDFAVVDGQYRWKCIEALSDRMNPGGLIYFDNSDTDKDARQYPQFGFEWSFLAQKRIAELENAGKVTVKELHGMINGELFAGSGMLIHFHR